MADKKERSDSGFKLSIVVPVFQNAANLNFTIPALLGLKKLPEVDLELIFVDDGSYDESFSILKSFYDQFPETIRIIKFTRNYGQIAAIQAGLRDADGHCVGVISADMQDPPELFAQMIDAWRGGAKLVICERERRDDGFWGAVWSNIFWRLVSRYAVKDYPKNGFDFCLMDRCIVDKVSSFEEKNTHIFPLVFSFGYSYSIIPYERRRRSLGKSQWTFSKKIKLFIDTFVGFSYMPIRAISLLGVTVSLLSIIYAVGMIVAYFIYGNPYTGWTTLAVLISTLSGLILMTLGIIGEYLWRILDGIRPRPSYIVEKRFERRADARMSSVLPSIES